MSLRLLVDRSSSIVRLVSVGSVDIRDLAQTLDALLADPEFNPATPLLVDLHSVTECSIFEIKDIAEQLARGPRRLTGGLALVATGVSHRITGAALAMYLSYEGNVCRVFEEEAAARSWLAHPSASFQSHTPGA